MAKKVDEKIPFDKGMVRVLVYGTLKQGHSNHNLLSSAGSKFIGYDSVTGSFNMWDLGSIPAVVQSATGEEKKVRGELWATTAEGLAALDLLEGHPEFYRRQKVWTDVHKRRCWMYCLHSTGFLGEDTAPVSSNLWHSSLEERKFWFEHLKAAEA